MKLILSFYPRANDLFSVVVLEILIVSLLFSSLLDAKMFYSNKLACLVDITDDFLTESALFLIVSFCLIVERN